MISAHAALQIGGAAALHRRNVHAAQKRHISPESGPGRFKGQPVPRRHPHRRVHGHRSPVPLRPHVRTGQRNDLFRVKFQFRPLHRAFQPGKAGSPAGFRLRIAAQQIGQPQRILVAGAVFRESPGQEPAAAQILHRGQKTGRFYCKRHMSSPFRRISSYSAASTGQNRTVSPGRHRVSQPPAPFSFKRRSGVRPISCQPPGDSEG